MYFAQVVVSETAELIKAIGTLWPFVLSTAALLFVIVCRKQLRSFFSKVGKVSGKTPLLEATFELRDKDESSLSLASSTSSVELSLSKEEEKADNTADNPNDFFGKMFTSILSQKFDDAKKWLDEVVKLEKDEDEKTRKKILYYHYSFLYGARDTFDEMLKIAEAVVNQQLKMTAFKYLGQDYLTVRNIPFAVKYGELALSLAASDDDIAEIVEILYEAYYETGDKNRARNFIYSHIQTVESLKIKAKLFLALSKFFDKEKDQMNKALALLQARQYSPTDQNIIFSTAYELSLRAMDILSQDMYRILIRMNPEHENAVNNLGVSLNKLRIHGESVAFYRKSVEFNNTLAYSNLANIYINAGLYADAKELLTKATTLENIHDNVWASLKTLADKQQTEKSLAESYKEQAVTFKAYLRDFLPVYFSTSNTGVELSLDHWNHGYSKVQVSITPNDLYYYFKWSSSDLIYEVSIPFPLNRYAFADGTMKYKDEYSGRKMYVFAKANVTEINLFIYDIDENRCFETSFHNRDL